MYDIDAQLKLHHYDAAERQATREERIAQQVRRARRIQRWADLFAGVSDRLSRMSRTTMARMP